jgi:hypothetical protein
MPPLAFGAEWGGLFDSVRLCCVGVRNEEPALLDQSSSPDVFLSAAPADPLPTPPNAPAPAYDATTAVQPRTGAASNIRLLPSRSARSLPKPASTRLCVVFFSRIRSGQKGAGRPKRVGNAMATPHGEYAADGLLVAVTRLGFWRELGCCRTNRRRHVPHTSTTAWLVELWVGRRMHIIGRGRSSQGSGWHALHGRSRPWQSEPKRALPTSRYSRLSLAKFCRAARSLLMRFYIFLIGVQTVRNGQRKSSRPPHNSALPNRASSRMRELFIHYQRLASHG